ncbi:hypothetical protein [Streptomyces sp. AC627_RSS907]|uniref:hypothetical protein n=1 Tax=Streptomyces sp. AC627_RSS907 TaxID=2823684 RepID=UPI0020B8EF1D
MRSHGRAARRHLRIAVQPVTAQVRARWGGLRCQQPQARMPADGDEPDSADVEHVCDGARELLLVAGLATRWGRHLRPGGPGRTVWAVWAECVFATPM